MTSDKRQFDDFTQFPGCIDDVGNYTFPSLYRVDSSGNVRIWSINIRLVKICNNIPPHKHDWDLMLDNTIPIKPVNLTNVDIPSGTKSQLWIETGVINGKISRHVPTYPCPKNVGKKNERNSLKQSLVLARSQYLKKYENGLRTESEFKSNNSGESKSSLQPLNNSVIKYFPMLVRNYDDDTKYVKYPLYVQPKLDGARMIAFLNSPPQKNSTYENVILYTRQKKEYAGFDQIRKDLLSALIDMWDFNNKQSIYIDGELYKHGMNLQTISGCVRNPNRDENPEYDGVKFYVFDIFYANNLDIPFKTRLDFIDDVFTSLSSTLIKKVKTTKVKTILEQENLYKQYLSKKYEGVILRNADSLYLTHPTQNNMSIRSKFVLKRKMKYSQEYEVVDFEDGTKGRDKGAIMWICITSDTNKLFSVTPKNITYDERYSLFKEAMHDNKNGFNNKFKGRMLTVEYEDLSKDKVPLRAKSIGFREHI